MATYNERMKDINTFNLQHTNIIQGTHHKRKQNMRHSPGTRLIVYPSLITVWGIWDRSGAEHTIGNGFSHPARAFALWSHATYSDSKLEATLVDECKTWCIWLHTRCSSSAAVFQNLSEAHRVTTSIQLTIHQSMQLDSSATNTRIPEMPECIWSGQKGCSFVTKCELWS